MDSPAETDAWMLVRPSALCAEHEAAQGEDRTAGKPKVPLGAVYVTPGIVETFGEDFAEVLAALRRHENGDWGAVCDEDAAENDSALTFGERILSAYETEHGSIWIITEADRSATTVLLPAEY